MGEPQPTGTCFWITGLAGAGKTTLAEGFVAYREHQTNRATVHLDGDRLRAALGRTSGAYSTEDRRELALTYSRLCHLLTEQGVDVVCSTISMFDAVRSWNRKNLDRYVEVFLDATPETLVRRNQKGLYDGGPGSSVVGVDLDAELPTAPDVHLVDDGSITPAEMLRRLIVATEQAETGSADNSTSGAVASEPERETV